MVKADSLASVQTAIAPTLGKAKAAIGEMSFVSDDKVSSEHSSSCAFSLQHVYEARLRKNKRGIDLISHALPFGRPRYEEAPDAVEYAKFYSRSHDAVNRVYDEAGNVIETHGPS
jgi:hypothetical protein